MKPWEKYSDGPARPWEKYSQDVRGGQRSQEAFSDKSKSIPIDDDLTSRQANIDYHTGVTDPGLRADFSRMDTEQERTMMLDKKIGKGLWGRDKYGQYIVSTKGMDKLGLKHRGLPVALDAHRVTLSDVADLRGDAPAIGGAVLGGIATGGTGFVPAVVGTAITAMGAQGFDEAADALRGENLQSSGEVAGDLAETGLYTAGGEAVFRGALRPLGRKLLAPEGYSLFGGGTGNMTPASTKAMHEAIEMGFRPKVSQIARPKIIGRIESLAEKLFGTQADAINQKAIYKNVAKFKQAAGPHTTAKHDLGELTAQGIKASKASFKVRATELYNNVDDAIKASYEEAYGQAVPDELAIIPTKSLKRSAQDLLDKVPKGVNGKPVFTGNETLKAINDALSLPDHVSVKHMQGIRANLREMADPGNVLPGISHRDMGRMVKAATSSFDDAAADGTIDPVARQALKVANRYYRMGINKFDDTLINRITRDPKKAGAIDPSDVVDAIFHRGSVSKIVRVKKVIPKDTWQRIRHKTMDDILASIEDKTSDPLQAVFNGKKFLNTLDKHGRDKLIAMYGKEMTDDLYKFGRNVNLISSKAGKEAMSGGLVTAYIALHPFKNLGRLARLKVMGNILSSKTGLKWFTEGLTLTKTRAASDAATRVTVMINALAEDETNAPLFNLPVEEPQALAEEQ